MVKIKKKNIGAIKRPLMKYDRNKLALAMVEILDHGLPIKTAAKKYNVPRSTLQDRVHDKVPINTKMGRMTILTPSEEMVLVRWLINLAKCGFPRKRDDLLNSVQAIIKEDQRTTPFNDQRPGRKWYSLFIQRHPELKERAPEAITKARAVVTEEYIRKWFREIKNYLTEMNALDILEDPRRILNGDETSFSICPNSGKVIAPVGWKNVYEIKPGSEKETITVLLVFSAAGETVVPMVVFPYQRPPKEVVNSMPPDWFLGRSKTGWMRSEIFFEYIANGVNPWLNENDIRKPVLLLVDGHKSHLTLELSNFCHQNDIILYALPANTTHMMQPADVSVFRPLKVEWRKTVKQWQNEEQNMGKSLNKTTFCPLLEKVLQKDMTNTIKNGFRKCGLYPFNPNAVDYSKCVKNAIENYEETEAITIEETNTAVRVIANFREPLTNKGIDVDLVIDIIQNSQNTRQNELMTEQKETEVRAKKLNETHNMTDIPEILCKSPQRVNSTNEKDLTEEFCESIQEISDKDFDGMYSMNKTTYQMLSKKKKSPESNKTGTCYQERTKESFIIHTVAEIHTEKNDTKTKPIVLRELNQNMPITKQTSFDLDTLPIIIDGSIDDIDKENISYNDTIIEEYSVRSNEELITKNETITDSLIENIIDVGSDFSVNLIESPNPSILHTPSSSKTPLNRSGSNTPSGRYRISPSFRNHLFSPKSLNFGKATKKKNNVPSAISSKAWRDYMEEKEKEKEEKEIAKKLRKIRIQKNKEDKAKKKVLTKKRAEARKKMSKNKKNKKSPPKEMSTTETVSHIKCVGCEEELISDVEDDDLKNIGCDKCPRWFHLKCTVHRGKPYAEVADKEFVCHVCFI